MGIDCLSVLCSENRYLLFLTENYAALDILKHYLSGVDSSQTLNTADVKQETMEPFVLFGSSFPKDQEYTQVGCPFNVYIMYLHGQFSVDFE